MTARTHDLAAFTALAIVVVLHPLHEITLSTLLVALLANQIGGIAPDIDQPTAPFWRNLPVGKFFGKFVDKLLGGHRFLSHSLLGLVLFAYLAKLLLVLLHPLMARVDTQLVWEAFIVGMLSHLVMDSFTKEGVPWLLPIPFKFGFPPLKTLRITTGKFSEHFVIFPVLLIITIWICSTHYQNIVTYLHQLHR
ncbi:MAG TPA: metal-dependent hydrolase [Candidatus Microsaccharimonas sp.]|nr:metal-dependent hydrolase [Candidatus Microsaccharimonas sp.]